MASNADKSSFKMTCHCHQQLYSPATSCNEIQEMKNDNSDKRNSLEAVQRQLDLKEREIQRLNNLLKDGLPRTQKSKDAKVFKQYEGIHELSSNVDLLQKETNKLQAELNASVTAQHGAIQRATMLEEKNRQLVYEIDVLEKAALEVKSKANEALDEKIREIAELHKQMDDFIHPVNTQLENNLDNEKSALRSEIKKITMEYQSLLEKLNECSKVVQILQTDNEQLSDANRKLKLKSSNVKESVEIPEESLNNKKHNETQPNDIQHVVVSGQSCEEELILVRNERDYFQKEYIQIQEQRNSQESVRQALRNDLNDKTLLIDQLRHDIELLKNSQSNASQLADAAYHQVERERDALKLKFKKLKSERNFLQEKYKELSESQISDQRQYDKQLQDLYEKLSRFEMEKSRKLSSQIPTKTTANLLGREIEELKQKLQQTEADNHKLRKRYNQIKVLQAQTERALTDQKNKLIMSECLKTQVESKLNTVDLNREESERQVGTLKSDLIKVKELLCTLEREKDTITIELDDKTERIFKLEADLRIAENDNRELCRRICMC